MSENIIGRFYFKRTSNGNLIGEFSNNKRKRIFTESADLIGNGSSFNGNYNSTWYDKKPIFAKLSIISNGKKYSLYWNEENKETSFWGEGILYDNILIGDYRNFKDIEKCK
jgi:hypothetical protein